MSPALPKLVSSPAAPWRSTSTTSRPRACKCKAAETPTIPAPRTTTSALSIRPSALNIHSIRRLAAGGFRQRRAERQGEACNFFARKVGRPGRAFLALAPDSRLTNGRSRVYQSARVAAGILNRARLVANPLDRPPLAGGNEVRRHLPSRERAGSGEGGAPDRSPLFRS